MGLCVPGVLVRGGCAQAMANVVAPDGFEPPTFIAVDTSAAATARTVDVPCQVPAQANSRGSRLQFEILATSACPTNRRRRAFERVLPAVFLGGQHLKIVWRIVRPILIFVVDNLSRLQQPTNLVLSQHAMQGIKALAISPWMRRIRSAIAVAATFTDGQYFEHGKDLQARCGSPLSYHCSKVQKRKTPRGEPGGA